MRRYLGFVLWLLLVAVPVWADMPWRLDELSQAPRTYPAEGFEAVGMRAIFFEGMPYHGKPSRVFAWYGAPDARDGEKVPAMVLIHGGGGTAFHEWVRLWNTRGYAAIAMDTCGCVPRGEYGKWERHEFGGPPGWGGFDQTGDPIEDQWTYHAVADAVLAHSLIRSFPEINPDCIGVTGISWGGYLTCIVAGVDSRFRLAVPVYGCGFLDKNSTWLDTFAKLGEEKTKRWISLWDPSVYLPNVRMPMLWVTGTNDFAYPMDSLQQSYRLPRGPRQLCIRIRMPHGHGGAGENPEEIRIFADSILKKGISLPRIVQQGRDGNRAWVEYQSETPVVKAELAYTKATGIWKDRPWESIPADLDATAHKASAMLPEATTVYYINIYDERGTAASSEHETLAAQANRF
ncbi:MAG TPA: acetylxylan esterase [Candidatus Hydrogenedentes bacterium]|nr:acetylxylan esterase [Candidatus Hydrogenedentota bacterium]